MQFPTELLYTKDHEWALINKDGTALIGITDHAQSALGDIVFVELPKVGRELKGHETFGVVESIKAVSDLYSPLAGTVLECNQAAVNEPALLNSAPYKAGWLLKIKIKDPSSIDSLLKVDAYKSYVEGLK